MTSHFMSRENAQLIYHLLNDNFGDKLRASPNFSRTLQMVMKKIYITKGATLNLMEMNKILLVECSKLLNGKKLFAAEIQTPVKPIKSDKKEKESFNSRLKERVKDFKSYTDPVPTAVNFQITATDESDYDRSVKDLHSRALSERALDVHNITRKYNANSAQEWINNEVPPPLKIDHSSATEVESELLDFGKRVTFKEPVDDRGGEDLNRAVDLFPNQKQGHIAIDRVMPKLRPVRRHRKKRENSSYNPNEFSTRSRSENERIPSPVLPSPEREILSNEKSLMPGVLAPPQPGHAPPISDDRPAWAEAPSSLAPPPIQRPISERLSTPPVARAPERRPSPPPPLPAPTPLGQQQQAFAVENNPAVAAAVKLPPSAPRTITGTSDFLSKLKKQKKKSSVCIRPNEVRENSMVFTHDFGQITNIQVSKLFLTNVHERYQNALEQNVTKSLSDEPFLVYSININRNVGRKNLLFIKKSFDERSVYYETDHTEQITTPIKHLKLTLFNKNSEPLNIPSLLKIDNKLKGGELEVKDTNNQHFCNDKYTYIMFQGENLYANEKVVINNELVTILGSCLIELNIDKYELLDVDCDNWGKHNYCIIEWDGSDIESVQHVSRVPVVNFMTS